MSGSRLVSCPPSASFPAATRRTAISGCRGEFKTAGFSNRDLRRLLFPTVLAAHERERRRLSAKLSRQLGLLRAHDLIKRIPRTHRFLLKQRGQFLTTALFATRDANIKSLLREATRNPRAAPRFPDVVDQAKSTVAMEPHPSTNRQRSRARSGAAGTTVHLSRRGR